MKQIALLLIGDIRLDGRVRKQIATLKSHGFAVTLVQWSKAAPTRPDELPDVNIIEYDHPLAKSAAANFVRQILFNLFALRILRRLSPDYVQCNDLNTLLAGYLFRRHAPIVYDAHELFPEQFTGLRKWVWSCLERWLVRGCDRFIHAEKNRAAYFASKYRIDPVRVNVVENFPSGVYTFSGRHRLRERFAFGPDRFILLYAGVMGPGRQLVEMIRAMAFLDDRFVLVLLGPTFRGFGDELEATIREANVTDRVRIHQPIENAEVLDFIHGSDMGLVFYQNTDLNNYWCASNKLYDFLFCGKPVVTNDYPGLLGVIAETKAGLCLPVVSPQTIADAVVLIARTSRAPLGASAYIWERQEPVYLSLFV